MWPSVSVWAQGFPTPLRVNYSKLPDEWGGGRGYKTIASMNMALCVGGYHTLAFGNLPKGRGTR